MTTNGSLAITWAIGHLCTPEDLFVIDFALYDSPSHRNDTIPVSIPLSPLPCHLPQRAFNKINFLECPFIHSLTPYTVASHSACHYTGVLHSVTLTNQISLLHWNQPPSTIHLPQQPCYTNHESQSEQYFSTKCDFSSTNDVIKPHIPFTQVLNSFSHSTIHGVGHGNMFSFLYLLFSLLPFLVPYSVSSFASSACVARTKCFTFMSITFAN